MAFQRLLLLVAVVVLVWGAWMVGEQVHGRAGLSKVFTRTRAGTQLAASSLSKPRPPATAAGATESLAQRSARFRHTRQCYFAWNRVATWRRQQQGCRSILDYGASATTEVSCQSNLEQARPQMQASRALLAGCPDAATVSRRYYEAARDAARAGDADAQACYLQDLFDNPDRTPLVLSAREVADYRQAAPRYFADGLARGDWRTVRLLAMDFVDGNTLLPLVASQRPMDKYVMMRLLQLGADGAYASLLEVEIQSDFLSPGFNTGAALTPRQAAEGSARARALYYRYFQGSARLQADPIPCPSN